MNPPLMIQTLFQTIKRLSPAKKRYLVIGVSVYLFELLVIVVAQRLGASSLLAVGLSFWLGLLVSFGLQKLVTFGDNRLHHRVVLTQFFAVLLLVVFNFGFTLLLTRLLTNLLPAVVCRTLALGITTLWNFYIYKAYIFNQSPVVRSKTTGRQHSSATKWLRAYVKQPRVAAIYLVLCLAILLATTVVWTLLGADLHQSNADQLVNSYLFQTGSTWHGAALPDQHSFLIKWPLFYLVKLFGYSAASYIGLTVLTTALTISLFVLILSRIERRPVVLGTICLALSSVLLLVPAQPYAGGLLPVNMAMLATRNLEYVWYIAGLYLIIKTPSFRSRRFLAGLFWLGLLLASDKLFLSVTVAGALLALVAYSLRRRWQLVNLSVTWLIAGLAATAVSVLILTALNFSHFVHISTQTLAGPYGTVHSLKSISLAVFYAFSGMLTNFGANPTYDALTIRQLPAHFVHNFFTPAAPAYVINLAIFIFVVVVGARIGLSSLGVKKYRYSTARLDVKLAVLLLWSTIAAIGLFIATNHYYVVDARYLTVALFGLFICLAAWTHSKKQLPAEYVLGAAGLLLVSIISGALGSASTHTTQAAALTNVNQRNQAIAQTLKSHHVKVLVGDYWRVVPTKILTESRQTVMPLAGCTQPRDVLTSRAWQPNLHRQSFAYLLTLHGSLTDYPHCSLQQVTSYYGLPNSSVLISGSQANPDELLLFYDHGISKGPTKVTGAQAKAAILPINLDELTHTSCQVPTIMNVVAHQDDDLLFMNPDLVHDIRAGNCVRSVYLTAGDAGADSRYWLGREQGSEAAYAEMIGGKPVWMQQVVRLPGGQFVSIDSPRGNNNVSLIFVRLPDGNLRGQGFGSSDHESLASLASGGLGSMRTVDRQSSYSAEQLVASLTALMHTYQPAEIRTQSNFAGDQYPDHSDHRTAGQFATQAHQRYVAEQYGNKLTIPLTYYMGYPIHEFPANLADQDLADKESAFWAYAAYDGGVCRSVIQCMRDPAYGAYLPRQYTNPY